MLCLFIIVQCNDWSSDIVENMGMEIFKNISVLKIYRMEVFVFFECYDLVLVNIVC